MWLILLTCSGCSLDFPFAFPATTDRVVQVFLIDVTAFSFRASPPDVRRVLRDAFPLAKAICGGIFAICFIVCRVVLWSTFSYYFIKDVWAVLQSTNEPRLERRKTWFKFTMIANGLLSLMQILWLGEIFVTGKKELENMGFL